MRTLILILLIAQAFYLCIGNGTNYRSISVPPENYVDPYAMIKEGQALLNEGDLVVRLHRDPTSEFIKNFNRLDKSYSHAGIVLFENGYPYIYHIVNGEENPDGKLRRDSLSRFCNPRKNISYGIFRYKLEAAEVESLKHILRIWSEKGVQFDSTFNLATDNRMYCSEMISKALTRATHKRILTATTKLTSTEAKLFSVYTHLPFSYTSKLHVVSIDNLYKNSFCHLIKEYNYKQ